MNRDQLQMSIDALLALAVTEAEARELALLPSREEMNAAFEPSQEFKQRIEKAMRETERKSTRYKLRRYTKRAAVTMAACLALFSCAMLPVRAVREAVVETLIEWQDKFASIIFSSEDATPTELPGKVELSYIPEGYTLQEEVNFDVSYFKIEYVKKSELFFSISITALNDYSNVEMDNEYSQYYALKFDGNNAIWTVREDNSNLLVWESDQFIYQLSGSLDVAELIKIARGINFS